MRSSWVVTGSERSNADVATVMGLIPASSNTVESEGRQVKQGWIKYRKKVIPTRWAFYVPLLLICRLSDFTEFGGCWDSTLGPLTSYLPLFGSTYSWLCTVLHQATSSFILFLEAVFRIHDILVWILLFSSLTFKTPNKNLIKKKFLLLISFEDTFTAFFKDKKSKRSHKTLGINVFPTIFA